MLINANQEIRFCCIRRSQKRDILLFVDCKFSCHWKCLSNVCRICVHVIASEAGGYTHTKDICPEQGLSKQGYRCAECKTQITFSKLISSDYTAEILGKSLANCRLTDKIDSLSLLRLFNVYAHYISFINT